MNIDYLQKRMTSLREEIKVFDTLVYDLASKYSDDPSVTNKLALKHAKQKFITAEYNLKETMRRWHSGVSAARTWYLNYQNAEVTVLTIELEIQATQQDARNAQSLLDLGTADISQLTKLAEAGQKIIKLNKQLHRARAAFLLLEKQKKRMLRTLLVDENMPKQKQPKIEKVIAITTPNILAPNDLNTDISSIFKGE
jgi:hypothetical protein